MKTALNTDDSCHFWAGVNTRIFVVIVVDVQLRSDFVSFITEEEARFIKNLSNVEGTETDSVKLICEVSKPSADVTWYKGDQELPEGGRYEHIVDGKRRILLIQDLKMADAGEYNCRLSPSIKTSGNLKINGNNLTGGVVNLTLRVAYNHSVRSEYMNHSQV